MASAMFKTLSWTSRTNLVERPPTRGLMNDVRSIHHVERGDGGQRAGGVNGYQSLIKPGQILSGLAFYGNYARNQDFSGGMPQFLESDTVALRCSARSCRLATRRALPAGAG